MVGIGEGDVSEGETSVGTGKGAGGRGGYWGGRHRLGAKGISNPDLGAILEIKGAWDLMRTLVAMGVWCAHWLPWGSDAHIGCHGAMHE